MNISALNVWRSIIKTRPLVLWSAFHLNKEVRFVHAQQMLGFQSVYLRWGQGGGGGGRGDSVIHLYLVRLPLSRRFGEADFPTKAIKVQLASPPQPLNFTPVSVPVNLWSRCGSISPTKWQNEVLAVVHPPTPPPCAFVGRFLWIVLWKLT